MLQFIEIPKFPYRDCKATTQKWSLDKCVCHENAFCLFTGAMLLQLHVIKLERFKFKGPRARNSSGIITLILHAAGQGSLHYKNTISIFDGDFGLEFLCYMGILFLKRDPNIL